MITVWTSVVGFWRTSQIATICDSFPIPPIHSRNNSRRFCASAVGHYYAILSLPCSNLLHKVRMTHHPYSRCIFLLCLIRKSHYLPVGELTWSIIGAKRDNVPQYICHLLLVFGVVIADFLGIEIAFVVHRVFRFARRGRFDTEKNLEEATSAEHRSEQGQNE